MSKVDADLEPAILLLNTIDSCAKPESWRSFDRIEINQSQVPYPTEIYCSKEKWDFVAYSIGGHDALVKIFVLLLGSLKDAKDKYVLMQNGPKNEKSFVLLKSLKDKRDKVYSILVVKLVEVATIRHAEIYLL
jgi:hypothetical protein